jgi:diguanylate cyclase (GGDEF)-like protein/PAS domain S-box-containing protein
MRQFYLGLLCSYFLRQDKNLVKLPEEGARRMQLLIRDLLAYCRGRTTGKDLQEPSGTGALEQVLSTLQGAILESGAAVKRDPVPTVIADGTRGLLRSLRYGIERKRMEEALFEEKDRAQVTLNCIGDAVMSTDVLGKVNYLNAVAENMTGWSRDEAVGRPIDDVLQIIDATTRNPVQNPAASAILENKTLGLTPNCILVRRDGFESDIENSAAPIHDSRGRVTGAVMVFRDVSEARTLSRRMSFLAQHDSLTQLSNRMVLNDRLTQAIAMAHRNGKKLAVLFLDVDRFKNINDSFGHAIGDRLLQSVSQRLLSCVRRSDTVSLQGGDEFVIVLSEVTRAADAAICADKILHALTVPHDIDPHHLHITASIGIATYPDDGTETEALMKNADFAMYDAKENGRNSYKFFKPEMNVRAIERQALESGLRQAIERQEFVLH